MSASADSPLTHIRQVLSTSPKPAPYRSSARARTSPTVAPGTVSRPVPAASRADAKSRRIATSGSYRCRYPRRGCRATRGPLPHRRACSSRGTRRASGTRADAGRARLIRRSATPACARLAMPVCSSVPSTRFGQVICNGRRSRQASSGKSSVSGRCDLTHVYEKQTLGRGRVSPTTRSTPVGPDTLPIIAVPTVSSDTTMPRRA